MHLTAFIQRHAVLLTVTLFTLAAGAAAVAVATGWLARTYYLRSAELRLAPVHAGRFMKENQALAPASAPRVIFFGDSRINGWNPKPRLEGFELLWRGIDGETTTQMGFRFNQDVLALQPAVIVMQAGINDLVAGVAVGRGAAARDNLIANMAHMADDSARSGALFVLTTVVRPARPPLWRRPVWSDSVFGLVQEVNRGLRAMASDRIRIVDADRILAGEQRAALEALPAQYARDTLHFNDAAYRVLNEELARQLQMTPHAVQ